MKLSCLPALTNRFLSRGSLTLALYHRFHESGTHGPWAMFVRDAGSPPSHTAATGTTVYYEAWLCWFRSPLGGEPYPSRGVTYSVLQPVVPVSPHETSQYSLPAAPGRTHPKGSGPCTMLFPQTCLLVFRWWCVFCLHACEKVGGQAQPWWGSTCMQDGCGMPAWLSRPSSTPMYNCG